MPKKEPDPPKKAPDTFDEHGQATLKGFRPDERWMVREYGE